MVKFIESELILLKKEVDEMWTLVYNQLDRAGEAVMTLDKELAQQVMVRERRVNAFELKIDSDIEDIIALYNPVAPFCAGNAENQYESGTSGRLCRRYSPFCYPLQGTGAGCRFAGPSAPGGDAGRGFIDAGTGETCLERRKY